MDPYIDGEKIKKKYKKKSTKWNGKNRDLFQCHYSYYCWRDLGDFSISDYHHHWVR